ncbi:MAG: hypothetical protein CMN44_10560 [SAR116 cluster bacterium]|nr:hypothetical protein [SAR116 cluster bacterium]RPH07576.1 MAG: DUF4340 domain-containing protein [Alphaproteobacteria bacterium TMED54]
MKSTFTKLLIVTAIFFALASYSVLENKDSNLFSERGNTFIENLPSKLNDIQKIKITGRDLDMELINKNNSFSEMSGYPLKTGVWESFITSLSLLSIEEKKTNNPERHNELNLVAIDKFKENDDENEPATKITFFTKDQKVFKSILLGKIDNTVGGISGGQFARYDKDNQAYLLKGALRMPSGKSDWFNSLLLKLDQDKLSLISVKREKIIFEIESKDKKLLLKNNPDLKIDEEKLKQVAEVIDAFYFYDVRKVNKIRKNNNNIISYKFKDGLILKLKFIEKSKNSKESWIEITAQSNNPETINEAKDLNEKTKGYQFLANINTSVIFNWNIKDLIKK